MGSINFHPWVQNYTGRYGKVFTRRLRSGKIITAMPRSTPPGPLSPAQAAFRLRFTEAADYGKQVFNHPVRSVPYKEQGEETHKSPFALILGEFVRNPLLQFVDTSAFHGQVGNTIDVRGRADLIALVEVFLYGETGAEIDGSEAQVMGNAWRFTSGIAIPIGTPLTVAVKVVDTSGLELTRRIPHVVA